MGKSSGSGFEIHLEEKEQKEEGDNELATDEQS
jgi:hypothetical protein